MAGGMGQNLKKWVTSFMDVPKIGIKFGFSLERICEKERREKSQIVYQKSSTTFRIQRHRKKSFKICISERNLPNTYTYTRNPV